MHKKVFIISGEPSGDLHGANLVESLKSQSPEIQIQCWGGDKMEAAGARVLKHVNELAFMGFVEVLLNIGQILKNFRLCKQHIRDFQPDLVVFIDYPGFNLRMAKFAHQLGIKTAYYISPQIWAWKESRVHKIKRSIDHVFVILPFEKEFFAKHGIDAQFVGHPLLDEFAKNPPDHDSFIEGHGLSEQPIIAVLPGSRTQEIKRILPLITMLPKEFPDHQILVSKVAWQSMDLYQTAIDKGMKVIEGNTYAMLANAEAAIVTSGTATLETALFKTPQVVVYKANFMSVWLARFLVKIKYISLVNLILDKPSITELIQADVTSKNIISEVRKLLKGSYHRSLVLQDYNELHKRLGGPGASKIVATELLKILEVRAD